MIRIMLGRSETPFLLPLGEGAPQGRMRDAVAGHALPHPALARRPLPEGEAGKLRTWIKINIILTVALLAAACGNSAPPVTTAVRTGTAPLSQENKLPDIGSERGSGVFGHWGVDRYGLPAYDYTMDQVTDPRAQRVELSNRRDHWSQLGNDAITANAYNHGYVQLWNQARMYQWANSYNEASRHYAGGYGYLHVDGQAHSTLWLDRPEGANTLRRFGTGYFERRMEVAGIAVEDAVTTPWGELPVLVHEVLLRNTTATEKSFSWWEYWDVNPEDRTLKATRGLEAPAYDAERRLLQVKQAPLGPDNDPLSIFLAAVEAPVEGFETDLPTFFGSGTRAAPQAVSADAPSDSIALPYAGSTTQQHLGRTLFALRAPLRLAPGATVRLRYVYGMAHAADIDGIVAQVRAQPDTQAATAKAWRAWLPRADFGSGRQALARELQWAAYMLRSSTMYEEVCGHHVVTQGGYYQYGLGNQIAFRDPLQHMLPLIYSEPELARETLRYSYQQQPVGTGAVSYGMLPMCLRYDFGSSNDLDFWLLLSTVEYVLATRDLAFLDELLPYRGGLPGPVFASGNLWEHVKLAYLHQETLTPRGPMGHYLIGTTGDWSDLSTQLMQITESVLVTTQLAYLYPRLAELAELYGDDAFAATVRARAAELLIATRGEWTGLGWYARGYSGTRQLGAGAIFAEPQSWALLAGAPDTAQTATLVGNIRRFLTGIGAPEIVKGPARIGSSQSPAANDPEVSETNPVTGVGDNNAVFVGGVWYSLNGPLVWALGRLDGLLPGAADYAFDEFERNTLLAHAEAYPEHWDGVLNVDDACWSHYSSNPGRCAVGSLVLLGGTAGQIAHQPAWTLFSALKLAGVEPTRKGYRIAPHLPLPAWSLRFPDLGIEQNATALRGYLRPLADGDLEFEIRPRQFPAGTALKASVNGQPVAATALDGGLRFVARGRAGQLLDWSVTPAR